ncbi:hypothetical protein PR202_gb14075 [Eleusine coracana subsp. coracana]|uniref:Protein kinase domain-containing protein n=1 Tax=Eleusine coracana subsp. coracana TaxID=191504 RepID=A0AAV5EU32_ELECO|nr:hypothetical protein PR202_gb14075 [Eleusine coracana subsp. coracana]
MASTNPNTVFLVFIVILVMVIVILLGICWKFIRPELMRKLMRPRSAGSEVPEYFSGNMSGNLRTITYFDYATLKKATRNFHQKNQLGRGGFGPVYLGKLDDGRKVAVKQLSVGKSGQGESEFFVEVNMITSIQHKNLVRLVGKTILCIRSRGYTAPEYAIRGELTVKADTYSFGVLVLELISSRKNTDLSLPNEMQYLPEHAWRLYEQTKILELVDPKLQADGLDEKEVEQVCQIALLCVQPYPNLRPAMSEVVLMLTMKSDQSIPAPMKPAFLDRKSLKDKNVTSDTAADMRSSSYWLHTPSPMVDKPYDMSCGI